MALRSNLFAGLVLAAAGGGWYAFAPPGSSLDRQLLEVARAGDLAKVQDALKAGASTKYVLGQSRFEGWTAEYPNPELGYSALHYAAISNHPQVVEALIKAGADVNAKTSLGNTALMLAVGQLDVPAAKFLLAHGAKKEIANNDGKTALNFTQKRSMNDKARELAALMK